MCNCIDIEMGSYSNQINVFPPFEPDRLAGIDTCIYNEIIGLWEKGVKTDESCCGHNKVMPYISVKDESITLMRKLGYSNMNKCPDRMDMFTPKSV